MQSGLPTAMAGKKPFSIAFAVNEIKTLLTFRVLDAFVNPHRDRRRQRFCPFLQRFWATEI
jgi:hypothetical protein